MVTFTSLEMSLGGIENHLFFWLTLHGDIFCTWRKRVETNYNKHKDERYSLRREAIFCWPDLFQTPGPKCSSASASSVTVTRGICHSAKFKGLIFKWVSVFNKCQVTPEFAGTHLVGFTFSELLIEWFSEGVQEVLTLVVQDPTLRNTVVIQL